MSMRYSLFVEMLLNKCKCKNYIIVIIIYTRVQIVNESS